MERILIVEDDMELNQALGLLLCENGYEVSQAFSIKDAKHCYEASVGMILLDVNLPDGDGFSFCKWLRERSHVPVIFLTARDLEEDVLTGYECGAEDYVIKPFSMKVLLKKIDVIRKRGGREGQRFDDGFLRMDFFKGKIWVRGQECQVTPTEFRILKELFRCKGQLLTYDILLETLWEQGNQFVDKHALAVNINRVRNKIEDEEHKYIANIYGMGYQWIG